MKRFEDMDKEFDVEFGKTVKSVRRTTIGFVLLTIAFNLAILGGIGYIAILILRNFGIL